MFAQTPEAFNYQAVVRNNTGQIIANQSVSFRIGILETTATGTLVYQETHTVTTNDYGLANFAIGTGTVISGTFATIDWGGDAHFVEIELDPAGGSSYSSLGTQQLVSVPYALNAKNVDNDQVDDADADPTNEYNTSATVIGTDLQITDGGGTLTVDLSPFYGGADNDADSTNELQTITKTGSTVTLSNGGGSFTDEVNDGDFSTTNELQLLSKSGNTISLSSFGGSVIDEVDDADADPTNELNTGAALSGTQLQITDPGGTVSVQLSSLVDDADADPNNEIQTLSKSGSTVSLSNGGGSFTDAVNEADASAINELQNLSISGSTLSISSGNSVTLPGGSDNLGNHSATQDLDMNGYNIDDAGRIGVGTATPSYPVDINLTGTGTEAGFLRVKSTNGNGFVGMWLDRATTADNGYVIWNTGGTEYWFMGQMTADPDFQISRSANGDATFHIEDANGRVGIGTASPSGLLSVSPANESYGFYSDHNKTTSGTTYGLYIDLDNTYTGSGTTCGARFDGYKNGGGGSVYGVYGAGRNYITSGSGTTYGVYAYGYRSSATPATTTYALYAFQSGSATTVYTGYFSGNVYTTGSYLPSDRKLKKNITPFSGALAQLGRINTYTYEYRTEEFVNGSLPEGPQVGVMVDEVEAEFPNLVKETTAPAHRIPLEDAIDGYGKEGYTIDPEDPEMAIIGEDYDFKAVNYAGLVPVLVQAIKEQQQKIDDQKAVNDQLRNELEQLKQMVEAMRDE